MPSVFWATVTSDLPRASNGLRDAVRVRSRIVRIAIHVIVAATLYRLKARKVAYIRRHKYSRVTLRFGCFCCPVSIVSGTVVVKRRPSRGNSQVFRQQIGQIRVNSQNQCRSLDIYDGSLLYWELVELDEKALRLVQEKGTSLTFH